MAWDTIRGSSEIRKECLRATLKSWNYLGLKIWFNDLVRIACCQTKEGGTIEWRQVAEGGEVIILVKFEFFDVHLTRYIVNELGIVDEDSCKDTGGTLTSDTWADVGVGNTCETIEVEATLLDTCGEEQKEYMNMEMNVY